MRVGFLGTGWIATYHSKSLRQAGGAIERAGCYDPDRSRAEAFAAASGHRVCDSESEVLDGCDAVYVTTWTSEHPRLVAEAARRGLAVFCEKPLATGLGEAEAMLAAVTGAGVTNQVGLVLRHSPAYLWARRLIADSAAGRTMAVVLRDDQSTLVSVWHDNLARASMRRVEVFCERRWVAIDGDDWFGPVTWTDADGTTGAIAGGELTGAAAALLDGRPNPDVSFVEAAARGAPASPDFAVAVEAHRVVEAMYRSARRGGMPVRPDDTVRRPPVPGLEIIELSADETLDIRRSVLRHGTPSTDPRFAQDALAGTWHLGLRLQGRVVGVSTWAPEAWPGDPGSPAIRLRGMAVDGEVRAMGAGALLLDAGIARARGGGACLIWASARDSALGFYVRSGFRIVGDGFVDEPTGLPHHLIVLAVP